MTVSGMERCVHEEAVALYLEYVRLRQLEEYYIHIVQDVQIL